MQNPTPLYSARSFRAQARKVLAGRWGDALIWSAVLSLIGGMLLQAGVSFNQVENAANPAVYWQLQSKIGPFFSVSYWLSGEMVLDAAEATTAPGLIAFSPAFLIASVVLSLVFLLLQPMYSIGQVRLSQRLVQGEALSAGMLHLSPQTYFRYIGAYLLSMLRALWLPLLVLLGGIVILILLPSLGRLLVLPLVIAFFALAVMRMLYYAPLVRLMVLRPEWTAKMLLQQCRILMTGRRAQLLKLMLSFTGWMVLSFIVAIVLPYGIQAVNSSLLGVFISNIVSALSLLPVLLYAQTALHVFAQEILGDRQCPAPVPPVEE